MLSAAPKITTTLRKKKVRECDPQVLSKKNLLKEWKTFKSWVSGNTSIKSHEKVRVGTPGSLIAPE